MFRKLFSKHHTQRRRSKRGVSRRKKRSYKMRGG